MPSKKTVEDRVRDTLEKFIRRSGIKDFDFRSSTDLIRGAGLTSLQGIEFALDLCEEFGHEFPLDFNPFVDDERHRGQTFGGLVKAVSQQIADDGEPSG